MDDQLRSLAERLDALEDVDVAEHADVLEEVHAALVAELDAVAGRSSDAPSQP